MAAKKAYLEANVENAVQLKWTNATGSSVAVGTPTYITPKSGKRMAAIVLNDDDASSSSVANGSTGQVLIRGRVKVAKSTSQAFTQGQTVWWDASAAQADDATTCNTMNDFVLGMCAKAAAATDTHVIVDLNEGPDAYSLGSSSSSSSSST